MYFITENEPYTKQTRGNIYSFSLRTFRFQHLNYGVMKYKMSCLPGTGCHQAGGHVMTKSNIWFYFSKSSQSKQPLRGQSFPACVFTLLYTFLREEATRQLSNSVKGQKWTILANSLEILANVLYFWTTHCSLNVESPLTGTHTQTRPLPHLLLSHAPLVKTTQLGGFRKYGRCKKTFKKTNLK